MLLLFNIVHGWFLVGSFGKEEAAIGRPKGSIR